MTVGVMSRAGLGGAHRDTGAAPALVGVERPWARHRRGRSGVISNGTRGAHGPVVSGYARADILGPWLHGRLPTTTTPPSRWGWRSSATASGPAAGARTSHSSSSAGSWACRNRRSRASRPGRSRDLRLRTLGRIVGQLETRSDYLFPAGPPPRPWEQSPARPSPVDDSKDPGRSMTPMVIRTLNET